MVDYDEIMYMLKKMYDKIEQLENNKAQHITAEQVNIASGNISIDAGMKSPIEIKEVKDVTINASGNTSSISVDFNTDSLQSVTLEADKISTVTIEVEGDMQGDVIAKES